MEAMEEAPLLQEVRCRLAAEEGVGEVLVEAVEAVEGAVAEAGMEVVVRLAVEEAAVQRLPPAPGRDRS